jgi:hypothetical protein
MDFQQQAAFQQAWALLTEGAGNRRHTMHTPVVAGVTADGRPDQRVMVLREASADEALLRFHTDARAPKVAQLQGRPVHILAYDPAAAIQLRIEGMARVETDGPRVDAIWAEASCFARRCYLAQAAPGTAQDEPASGLPATVEGRQPEEPELIPARPNFAILLVDVSAIDWLHLANSGHRRCRFERSDTGWSAGWIQP